MDGELSEEEIVQELEALRDWAADEGSPIHSRELKALTYAINVIKTLRSVKLLPGPRDATS